MRTVIIKQLFHLTWLDIAWAAQWLYGDHCV